MTHPHIKVGDLVYHLLYGRKWLAIVLDMSEVETNCSSKSLSSCREYVLVQMQLGSTYELHFEQSTPRTKVTDSRGLISHHWLRHARPK